MNIYPNNDFIYEATSKLEELINIPIQVDSNRDNYDALLTLSNIQFVVETRSAVRTSNQGIILSQLEEMKNNNSRPIILIAEYISKKATQELKERGINYIDVAGNAFIKYKDLAILVEGQKNTKKAKTNQSRAFQETGLKIIFHLLNKPEHLQDSYRRIAEQSPLQERASEIVNDYLGDAVGKVYVNSHFSPQTKARMGSLVSNVKLAFRKRIERADWLSKDTKEKAISKLSKMQAQIGYPEKWRGYTGIELEEGDLIGNINTLNVNKHNELRSKVGQTINTSDWWLPPHIPNAYYNQNRNEVVFTAAILQPPLFNLEVDEAVIYGVVGGLISHEMTHGFDDEGGDFDENGALRRWWSASSEDGFNKKSRVLVNQYNAYSVLDSLHINGEVTLGENIADLGSLNIALKAYKLSLNDKEPPVLDGFTGLQRVFLGYAQIWRGKYRDEALRMSVKSGHHSPREFRVNGVVRNIPEFYTLFDITPEDSLYLPPNQRVEIW